MADIKNRIPFNMIGKYYVDFNCICCGICTLTAPHNFMMNLEGEYGFIGKQPQIKEEEEAIIKAMINCPVGAIGNDGDSINNLIKEDQP